MARFVTLIRYFLNKFATNLLSVFLIFSRHLFVLIGSGKGKANPHRSVLCDIDVNTLQPLSYPSRTCENNKA